MTISAYLQASGTKTAHQRVEPHMPEVSQDLDLFQLMDEHSVFIKKENFAALLGEMGSSSLASSFVQNPQSSIKNYLKEVVPIERKKMKSDSVLSHIQKTSQPPLDIRDRTIQKIPQSGKQNNTVDENIVGDVRCSLVQKSADKEGVETIKYLENPFIYAPILITEGQKNLHSSVEERQFASSSLLIEPMGKGLSQVDDESLKSQIKKWVSEGKLQITQTMVPFDENHSQEVIGRTLLQDQGVTLISGLDSNFNDGSIQDMGISLLQQEGFPDNKEISDEQKKGGMFDVSEVMTEHQQESLVPSNLRFLGVEGQQNLSPLQPFPMSVKNSLSLEKSIAETNKVTGIQQTASSLSGTKVSTAKGVQSKIIGLSEKVMAIQQLKNQIKMGLRKGETHLMIRLTPNSLGKVDLKLDISKDGIVSAFFKADSRETMSLLTKHAEELRNIFNDSGLKSETSGMNFSHSEQQGKSFGFEEKIKPESMGSVDQDETLKEVPSPIHHHSGKYLSYGTIDIQV